MDNRSLVSGDRVLQLHKDYTRYPCSLYSQLLRLSIVVALVLLLVCVPETDAGYGLSWGLLGQIEDTSRHRPLNLKRHSD